VLPLEVTFPKEHIAKHLVLQTEWYGSDHQTAPIFVSLIGHPMVVRVCLKHCQHFAYKQCLKNSGM